MLLLILGWTISLTYLITFGQYLSYFKSKRERTGSSIRKMLIVALALHTLYLVLAGVKLGHLPVGDIYKVLTTCAWFFALKTSPVHLFPKH